MELEPQPLESVFRVEKIKRHLKELDREELEEFTQSLLEVTSKLTHQTAQLLAEIKRLEAEYEEEQGKI